MDGAPTATHWEMDGWPPLQLTWQANKWHCNKRQRYDWPIRPLKSIILINLVLRTLREKIAQAQVDF